ncbi:MAG TPA: diaminopimelate epimerase [Rhizomicrobium sp.]|jgi:diaminopimelate epimerase|nr:diaminopimelate epimerase [Rhizomicrobium sp.]
MTAFCKMHGLGNDFVVFDARDHGLALDETTARAIADRRRGVGCDQVIVIERPKISGDAFMRIFNADGDEVEACGNAARCVARLLMEEKDETAIRIDTRGGLLDCCDAANGCVTVDMGVPRSGWQDIPLAREVETAAFPLMVNGVEFVATAVSIGNPHCVIFTDDAGQISLSELGPRIECHDMFPARVNVEFASVIFPGRLRMRVWERGAGITEACGTGACATVVAAHRRGLSPRVADVILDGGELNIEWRAGDDHILMTGPTSLAFKGDIDLTAPDYRA